MPKKKQVNKTKKGIENKASAGPETANEFLSAGVEHEEAGEKWRAGDAAKSARFFARAIESYDDGLKRFPQSGDLAFNKARLQFDIAQQPRILAHLATSATDQLNLALNSHRIALRIDPNDENLMYNTAQVLTSLAEAIESGNSTDINNEALCMYKEALKLFQHCLGAQELKFNKSREEAARSSETAAPTHDEDPQMADSLGSASSDDERWVTVVDPVTANTLLDTIIEVLATLGSICHYISLQDLKYIEDTYGFTLKGIEEYFLHTISDKLDTFLRDPTTLDREDGIKLAVANFSCALAHAYFVKFQLSLSDYENEVNLAFSSRLGSSEDRLLMNPLALLDKASAEIAFSNNINTLLPSLLSAEPPHSIIELNNLRWRHLTTAWEVATAASKQKDHELGILPRIHIVRGDCELLRCRLREKPCNYALALNYSVKLLQNAEKCYRGAAVIAEEKGAVEDEREARIKSAVVLALSGIGVSLGKLVAQDAQSVREVIEQMREDGFISSDDIEVISRLFP